MIPLALGSVNIRAAHQVTGYCAVLAITLAFLFEG